MSVRLISILILGCAGLMIWVPSAVGTDAKHFQAMQLTKLSKAMPLPDVRLPNVKGEPVSLASFRDHVMLVNFWTTW